MRGSQPWRTNRSRVLRSQPIAAETKLWSKLRGRRLGGLKFVRQAPVGPNFVDFLCREEMVIVEVDGGTHGSDTEVRKDDVRTIALQSLGYRVFRVRNIDIYEKMDNVLDSLLDLLERSKE